MSAVTPQPAPVRALVLDADGVMQDNPAGWLEDVTAVVAPSHREQFAQDLFGTEVDAMTGRRPFAEVLEEVCGRWGVREHVAELRRHWRRVEVCPDMVELVRDLRRSGVPCHLATNQNEERAAYLRHELGYADLFDRLFLSCEVGATKSDAGFFEHVVDATGSQPHQLLFVDDKREYVERARLVGLQAATWCLADGLDPLRDLLAHHGIGPRRSA